MGFPGDLDLQCGRPGFNPWIGKIPWKREWLPTPVFWPGEFHGQRSLVGYSPWGHSQTQLRDFSLCGTHYFRSYEVHIRNNKNSCLL